MIEKSEVQQVRFARPVTNLEKSSSMYERGLGLRRVGSFADHDGFDGVMLQGASSHFHLEFTRCTTHPVAPSPTPEDMLVFYIPDANAAAARCAALLEAGFEEVQPINPYWAQNGRTFRDADGYLVVIQNAAWNPA